MDNEQDQIQEATDRESCCIYINEHWDRRLQIRQGKLQLQHGASSEIYAPDSSLGTSDTKKQPSIASLFFKENQKLTVLEMHLQWIVTEKQVFTTIESPAPSKFL
ncbi:uncharacterized protein V1513DRAFT_288620 [Lipomyces chichibuensis]|uniref:uncharacterized protein n=1 Tax=Lipomyces chichibuensis TaxID=1546026 RepID=UPI003343C5EF